MTKNNKLMKKKEITDINIFRQIMFMNGGSDLDRIAMSNSGAKQYNIGLIVSLPQVCSV